MRWSGILAAVLLFVVLGLVAAWTQSAHVLVSARMALLAAAAGSYSASFLVFSVVWARVVSKAGGGTGAQTSSAAGFWSCFFVSTTSLAGLLTPMNLGTDVLRSMLGRKYLDRDLATTAAASIVTRECKLRVTLLFFALAVSVPGLHAGVHFRRILIVIGGTLTAITVLALFRSDAARGLARALRLDRLADTTRTLRRRVGWPARGLFYLLFAAGFAGEWQALRFCFQALDLPPDPRNTLVGVAILYGLSRTPVLPLGIGLVETGGLAVFRIMNISMHQAGALVIAWGFIRVAVPYLLTTATFVPFLYSSRRRPASF